MYNLWFYWFYLTQMFLRIINFHVLSGSNVMNCDIGKRFELQQFGMLYRVAPSRGTKVRCPICLSEILIFLLMKWDNLTGTSCGTKVRCPICQSEILMFELMEALWVWPTTYCEYDRLNMTDLTLSMTRSTEALTYKTLKWF